jgi:asparaginyl-tRNA synthetase
MFSTNNLQNQKKRAVLKVRAKVLNSARHWFNNHDFTEVQGPTLIPATGEWPGYFEVKYFDKKAYLAQGLQPYADAFVTSLGKVYTIAPTFRAEKQRAQRHLTEFWRIEAAVPECNLDGIIRVQEELVTHICYSLCIEAREELMFLRGNIKDMAKIKAPFPKITYDEAIEMLQRDGFRIFWGEELAWDMERKLSLQFDKPFFIKEFPTSFQTFFYKSSVQRQELTLSADLIAPEGYGEISGGGQMINEKKVLLKKMNDEEINPADQRWYMDLRMFDSVSQSGFMLGLERFIQWICKLNSIDETSAFPRSPDKLYP